MPVDPAFYSAFLAPPPTIGGVKLKRFSLAHGWFLKIFESPFVVGGTAQPQDIAIFLWICSSNYNQLHNIHENPEETNTRLEEILSTLPKHDHNEICKEITDYLKNYIKQPLRFMEKESTDKLKCDPSLYYAVLLMRELGWSEEKAWDTSYSMATSIASICCVLEGSNNLYSDEDIERVMKKFGDKI